MLLEAEREAARAHLAVEAATERLKRHKAAQEGAPPASWSGRARLGGGGLVDQQLESKPHAICCRMERPE